MRIDSWRTTYRGLIPDAYLDGMQVDASTALWDRVLDAPARTPPACSSPTHDGEVVGFAAGNVLEEPKLDLDAELSAVYLRRELPARGRRPAARRAPSRRRSATHGATGIIVWVIAGNKGARAFYEQPRRRAAWSSSRSSGTAWTWSRRVRLRDLDATLPQRRSPRHRHGRASACIRRIATMHDFDTHHGDSMTIKVAINGYGRIGRNILRAHYEGGKKHDIAIVAINDLGSPETNAHLTRYDTAHGKFPGKVDVDGDAMVVDGDRIKVFAQRDPAQLPWGRSASTSCSSARASSRPRRRRRRT